MTANPYWPLPLPDSIGALVGADDVRNAVKNTILEWSSYYLAIVSQRLVAQGRIGGTNLVGAPLPGFGTWDNDPQFRSLGTGMPAAFLVTTPATVANSIELQGNRQYRAAWRAQVNLWVYGTTWEMADDITSWYEKAVRLCLLQHRTLGNQFATGTKWVGNSYTSEIHDSTRTIGKCAMAFDVLVNGPVIEVRGPATLPVPAVSLPDDPTVNTVDITLARVPVNESLPDINDQFEAEED